MKKAEQFVDELIQQEALPASYKQLVKEYIWPLVEEIASQHEQKKVVNKPWLLGLQGTQGSGKSTVCLFIKNLLEQCFKLNVAVLSIDDFYKTHQERIDLSKTLHPLLLTRGVPGSHDLSLAYNTLNELSKLTEHSSCIIPTFNKAMDDRESAENWKTVSGPIDIIVLEGWCVGVSAQPEDALKEPINTLEHDEDKTCVWRKLINEQLKTEYADFYAQIDDLIVLQAPSFECVYEWRLLQESKLIERSKHEKSNGHLRVQTPEQIKRFVDHYERLTRHALSTLKYNARWVLTLDNNHDITALIRNVKGWNK